MSRPPVESIELRFDDAGAAAVHERWAAVEAVGVNAMSKQPYNYPHVTLAALAHTGGALAAARGDIAAVVAPLVGLELSLSGPALFPHSTSVLYAAVVPRERLLVVHRALHELLTGRDLEPYATSRPDAWTPHCTIAKRVKAPDLGAAIGAAGAGEWPIEVRVASVIHWDGAGRELTELAPG